MAGTRSAWQSGAMLQIPGLLSRALAIGAIAVVVVGCGSASSSSDASGGGGSGGGGSGDGGSGGGGGAAAASCPVAPPTGGQTCIAVASCFYEDCAGSGRTVATCANGMWSVETGPCTGVFCQSQTCQPGQVCVMRAGGALLVECAENACGAGAIGCGCLQSCAGTCVVTGSLQSGVTIQCNTCSSNQCA